MTFKLKLLLTFVVYGLSLVIFTQFVSFKLDEKNIKLESIEEASKLFAKKERLFELYIQNTNLKILAVNNSKTFQKYLQNKEKISEVNSLFLDIASTSDNIMQLRYIDKNGMEIIRVDRDAYSSKANLVEEDQLQDKSARYYFHEVMNQGKEKFWYSKLDLNIERKKIEEPLKPVLRIGMPTFYQGEKVGMLIVNIFMKNFLKELVDDGLNNIYLYDKNGKLMVDSLHKHCWSRYIGDLNQTIKHLKNENLTVVLSQERYVNENIFSSAMFLNNDENIHMIIEPKNKYIQDKLSANAKEMGFVLLFMLALSIPLSYFFSKIPAKLKDKVDRQKAEQDVLLSLFDLGEVVLFKWNNDENWSVSSVSKSVEKLFGYDVNDFTSAKISFASRIHSDDVQRVMDEVNQALDDEAYFFEHKPYRIITKDKKIKWILDSTAIARDKNGEVVNFIGYLTDVTELKDNEILLRKLSRTDQLTQIYNRMCIDETLQTQHYRFNRVGEECSIILIDIDYFKSVNDEYGHLVGDKILIEFAKILSSTVRAGDSVGRWGGEEFIIILPHTSLKDALLLAEKQRVKINDYVFTAVKRKTASFGVSTLREEMSVEVLIDEADKALYKSKEDGRNRVSTIQIEI